MNVLEQISELNSKIYIGGEYRKSNATSSIDVIDPATEQKLGEIPETTEAEMDEAIARANQAQKAWNARSPLDRSHVMHEVANKLAQMTPIFGEALTREMGKPYKESVDEVHWSVHNIRYYAAHVARLKRLNWSNASCN